MYFARSCCTLGDCKPDTCGPPISVYGVASAACARPPICLYGVASAGCDGGKGWYTTGTGGGVAGIPPVKAGFAGNANALPGHAGTPPTFGGITLATPGAKGAVGELGGLGTMVEPAGTAVEPTAGTGPKGLATASPIGRGGAGRGGATPAAAPGMEGKPPGAVAGIVAAGSDIPSWAVGALDVAPSIVVPLAPGKCPGTA